MHLKTTRLAEPEWSATLDPATRNGNDPAPPGRQRGAVAHTGTLLPNLASDRDAGAAGRIGSTQKLQPVPTEMKKPFSSTPAASSASERSLSSAVT